MGVVRQMCRRGHERIGRCRRCISERSARNWKARQVTPVAALAGHFPALPPTPAPSGGRVPVRAVKRGDNAAHQAHPTETSAMGRKTSYGERMR
jgi:hypothetical protein